MFSFPNVTEIFRTNMGLAREVFFKLKLVHSSAYFCIKFKLFQFEIYRLYLTFVLVGIEITIIVQLWESVHLRCSLWTI